jgi:hypothetical protein
MDIQEMLCGCCDDTVLVDFDTARYGSLIHCDTCGGWSILQADTNDEGDGNVWTLAPHVLMRTEN